MPLAPTLSFFPLSYLSHEKSTYGYNTEPCGDEMGHVFKPVHDVHITSKLSLGLPIHGIDLLMGNYIASGKVTVASLCDDMLTSTAK